ncbi:Hyaluronidase-3 [Manis pentadactyla]|nr:Hyaluronidase-3 [Manis pentadactyla]
MSDFGYEYGAQHSFFTCLWQHHMAKAAAHKDHSLVDLKSETIRSNVLVTSNNETLLGNKPLTFRKCSSKFTKHTDLFNCAHEMSLVGIARYELWFELCSLSSSQECWR